MANLSVSALGVQALDVAGVRRRWIGQYTGPVSYAAAGDSFLPTEVSMGVIGVIHGIASNGSAVRLLAYDSANGVVHWFIPNTGAEVAGAVDLSAFVARIEVVGR